jgi:hypothetical protein
MVVLGGVRDATAYRRRWRTVRIGATAACTGAVVLGLWSSDGGGGGGGSGVAALGGLVGKASIKGSALAAIMLGSFGSRKQFLRLLCGWRASCPCRGLLLLGHVLQCLVSPLHHGCVHCSTPISLSA